MLIDNVIGIVGAVYKGNYNSTTTYEYLNVVTYDGSSYICIKEEGCTGITPTNETYWQLMAKKGEFTEEDKEEFKQAVVQESKTEINEHTETKKTELDNYTTDKETSLKNELDAYKTTKETELDKHKSTLETEMTITKNSLVEEIEEAQNGFDANVTAKTNSFNNNVIEQINTFNNNVTAKTEEFDENANTKKTEYNENATAKLEEYNNNHTAKLNEFNENAESYEKRIAELETERDEFAEQMPWNTTDISESIHIEDSAKYSRNKLNIFGNLKQETREGYNLIDTRGLPSKTINGLEIINTNGYPTVNGTSTAGTAYNNNLEEFILGPGDYTFVVPYYNSTTNVGVTVSLGYNNVANSNFSMNNKTRLKSVTLTEETAINQLRMYFENNNTFNNYEIKVMLLKGTYTAETLPPYELYGAMPSINYPSEPTVVTGVQKITKCEDNLFNINSDVYPEKKMDYYVKNKINITKWDGGGSIVTENGKITAGDSSNSYKGVRISAFLNPNTTYYMNFDFESELNTVQNTLDYKKIENGKNTIAFTTDDEGKKHFGISTQAGKGLFTMSNIIISENNIDFEEYNGEDITLDLGTTELCKITDTDGNVIAQDKAVYRLQEDGTYKWQWKKNVGKLVSTDATGFSGNGNGTYTKNYLTQTLNVSANKSYDTLNAICNVMKATGGDYTTIFGSTSAKKIRLNIENKYFEDFEVSTLSELFTKLNENGNTFTLYYPFETAEYEDCTETQSAKLDKLYKLALAQGTNNIFVESENGVTTELQLEYMQDNSLIKEQEHKEFEDRITAIENLLSTTTTSAMLLDNLQTDLESEVN